MAQDLADRQEQRLSVKYGNEEITFGLVPSDRATLEIAVLPDGSVVVKAPRQTSWDDVTTRVARRGQWILRQQRYFAQFQPRTPPRRYVGGETHLYLGRHYRLAVEHGESEGTRLIGGWFRVTVSASATPDRIHKLLDDWYRERAARLLDKRLEACWEMFPAEGLAKPVVRLRRMTTRWGSLSSKGTLSLRPDLVRAPRDCIDYVIVHELCHLVHADHGPAFYRLLEHVLPDWQRRKHRLEVALA